MPLDSFDGLKPPVWGKPSGPNTRHDLWAELETSAFLRNTLLVCRFGRCLAGASFVKPAGWRSARAVEDTSDMFFVPKGWILMRQWSTPKPVDVDHVDHFGSKGTLECTELVGTAVGNSYNVFCIKPVEIYYWHCGEHCVWDRCASFAWHISYANLFQVWTFKGTLIAADSRRCHFTWWPKRAAMRRGFAMFWQASGDKPFSNQSQVHNILWLFCPSFIFNLLTSERKWVSLYFLNNFDII